MQPQRSIVGQDFVCLSFAYCFVLFRESAVETPARIQPIITLQDKNTRDILQQLLVKANTYSIAIWMQAYCGLAEHPRGDVEWDRKECMTCAVCVRLLQRNMCVRRLNLPAHHRVSVC